MNPVVNPSMSAGAANLSRSLLPEVPARTRQVGALGTIRPGARDPADGVLSVVVARRPPLDTGAPGEARVHEEIVRAVEGQSAPIVIVANSENRDRIVLELTIHLGAALPRSEGPAQDGREVDNLLIDKEGHSVTVGGEEVLLTNLEFKLLVALADRKGHVQTRGRLLSDVWGVNAQNKTRTVDTHIKRLRDKLRGAGKHIQAVRGVGYRFSDRSIAQRARVEADNQSRLGYGRVVAA